MEKPSNDSPISLIDSASASDTAEKKDKDSELPEPRSDRKFSSPLTMFAISGRRNPLVPLPAADTGLRDGETVRTGLGD
jgi:hypothetical protein